MSEPSHTHTPGPWVWHGHDGFHELVHHLEGSTEGRPSYIRIHDDGSAGDEYSPSIDVNGPDGKLIAAAPDLLEALKEFTAALVACSSLGLNSEEIAMLKRGEAAIAKATTGGQG
jgi:hypothetical protein